MESIPVSKFKATCLAAVERVRKTRRPIQLTRFGRAVAEVVPVERNPKERKWLGAFAESASIEGDILSPVDVHWDATDS